MSFPAREIIRRAVDILVDLPSRRWTVDRLVRYLNDGMRAIGTLRPDMLIKREDVALVDGFKQVIPDAGEKFFIIHANAEGSMREVTQSDFATIGALDPKWKSKSKASEILHWDFDPASPREFHVYPPAVAGTKLDMEYVLRVVEIVEPAAGKTFANVTGDIDLPDAAREPLLDYVLAKCHSESNQYAQPARALLHFQAFANGLGIDAKATGAISSNPPT